MSLIRESLCCSLRKVTTALSGLTLRTANNEDVKPLATCTARVTIQENVYLIQFIFLASCSHDIILGWDFLSRHHAIIRCARAEVELFPLDDTAIPERTAKLIATGDTEIPPRNSVLVSVSCDCLSGTTIFFAPLAPFSAWKCLPLPFAVVEIRSRLGAIFVLNPSSCPATLVRSECLGHVEPFDSHLSHVEPFDSQV